MIPALIRPTGRLKSANRTGGSTLRYFNTARKSVVTTSPPCFSSLLNDSNHQLWTSERLQSSRPFSSMLARSLIPIPMHEHRQFMLRPLSCSRALLWELTFVASRYRAMCTRESPIPLLASWRIALQPLKGAWLLLPRRVDTQLSSWLCPSFATPVTTSCLLRIYTEAYVFAFSQLS
jgi:hypothetical protein